MSVFRKVKIVLMQVFARKLFLLRIVVSGNMSEFSGILTSTKFSTEDNLAPTFDMNYDLQATSFQES
jgi:hypothetical protein